ncbi:MAG: hypothetical protein QGG62_00205 [Candidatus Poseidoniaceae archaeon]|nr:hypothetical protein [Candidatus Poseidoniaceae archaeon]
MDKRAKITILVGLGIFVFGIIGFVIGGFGIAGLEESTKFTLEEVDNGSIEVIDSDGFGDIGMTFWVKGEYVDKDENGIWDMCETVEVSVTEHPDVSDWSAHDGEFYYEVAFNYDGKETSSCDADLGNTNYDRKEQGYVKIGRACYGCFAGNFSFVSNENVSVTYDDVMIEELGEDIGLIALGFVGGSGALCCGAVIMIIGVILIFTLKEDAPVEMMVNSDGTYMMNTNPGNNIGVGVSQNMSQVMTSSVVTEEMTKAEPYQFPSTDGVEKPESVSISTETKVEAFEQK